MRRGIAEHRTDRRRRHHAQRHRCPARARRRRCPRRRASRTDHDRRHHNRRRQHQHHDQSEQHTRSPPRRRPRRPRHTLMTAGHRPPRSRWTQRHDSRDRRTITRPQRLQKPGRPRSDIASIAVTRRTRPLPHAFSSATDNPPSDNQGMSIDAIVESPCSNRRQPMRPGRRVDFHARAHPADRLDLAVGWRPDHRPRRTATPIG